MCQRLEFKTRKNFIVTALKSQLVKRNTKTKLYRDYSEFDMDNFKAELDDKMNSGIVLEKSKKLSTKSFLCVM